MQKGAPLFPESLLRWPHGPAVWKVWLKYRDYGAHPIASPADYHEDDYLPEGREILEAVHSTYGQFTASKLSAMTDDEPLRVIGIIDSAPITIIDRILADLTGSGHLVRRFLRIIGAVRKLARLSSGSTRGSPLPPSPSHRPSSGEGDARVKAGGATGNHFGEIDQIGSPAWRSLSGDLQQASVDRPTALSPMVRQSYSSTASPGGDRPFRSLPTLYGERERSPSIDPLRRCQPAAVRQSRPARSSDSSTSPKRSFLTPRESRNFARVTVAPGPEAPAPAPRDGAACRRQWACSIRPALPR